MDCQRLQDQLSDYIDGLLSPSAIAAAEAHLSRCSECQRDVEQLRQAVSALRSLPPIPPPAYFVHAVQARIAREAVKPRQSLPAWLYPSRQGFALRFALTAAVLVAVVPQLRHGAADGARAAWDLLGLGGRLRNEAPVASPQRRPHRAPTALAPLPQTLAPTNSEPWNLSNSPTTSPTALPVHPAPVEIHRPAPTPLSLAFHIDGIARAGAVLEVAVAAKSSNDQMNSTVDAYLSNGARFLNGSASAVRVWSGNLGAGVPISTPVRLRADQPGLYEMRVAVHTGRGELEAADLLLPVGLQPAAIDISSAYPTDLYTALGTLAQESGRPIVVEEGLQGTLALQVQSHDFDSALPEIANQFGCGAYQADGIAYVSLHP